jgi:hypothetical protein
LRDTGAAALESFAAVLLGQQANLSGAIKRCFDLEEDDPRVR